MRVLVTGSKGFIGRAVVDRLNVIGHQPVHYDHADGNDVRRYAETRAALFNCDGVIHLAGVLGTEELFDDIDRAIDVNVRGTANVLRGCVPRKTRYVGITMPDVWDNVYQATKLAAKRLADGFQRHHDVPVSHVRAFNAYGPGQAFGASHPQKIIPTFAVAAWRGEPIPIWGDGTQTVDMVHVDDIARMLVDALHFGHRQVFDAGTGVAQTVLDVAHAVLSITGSTAGVQHLPMRLGEHETKIVADGDGWGLLGWRPSVNEAALAAAVNWYRTRAL